MRRTIASAAAGTAIGAAAMIGGAATQPAVVAAPEYVSPLMTCDTCHQNFGDRADPGAWDRITEHVQTAHPDEWARITGDGR